MPQDKLLKSDHRLVNIDLSSEIQVHSDPAKNLKYHQIAKEFANNGLRQRKAYATVSGKSEMAINSASRKLFKKPWMIELCKVYLAGKEQEEPTKEWALSHWRQMIEANIVDFLGDDGNYLTVPELRKLPVAKQQMIKKMNISTEQVVARGPDKRVLLDAEDRPIMVTIQKVNIELYDKTKALRDMARAERWIQNHMSVEHNHRISANNLVEAANRRVNEYRVIEGEVIDDEKDS